MKFQKLPISKNDPVCFSDDVEKKAKSLAICSNLEARTCLDYDLASTLCVLPLGFTGNPSNRILQIAVPNDSKPEEKSQLRFATNSQVRCIEIEPAILRRAIEISYKTDDIWLAKNLADLIPQSVSQFDRLKLDFENENINSPVPNALRALLEYSIAKGASDIHFLPTRAGMTVKLRVNGELLSHQEAICTSEVGARLISRIKVLALLRIDERSLPQDGSFSINLKSGIRHLRVSTLPTIHGEKCVLRICSDIAAQALEKLGFTEETLSILFSSMERKSGLLLLSGSTGSGKTTTLYGITQELIKMNLGIATVEDPVEFQIEGISQTSLAPEKGLDYPNALRSILRQDPDVILVGEIRDSESAELVVSAALTGHLVLSTVHASSAKESILRLLQMGIDSATLNQVLSLVINQSLVKRLCPKCKVIDLSSSQYHNKKIYRSVGCASCDYSGFDGRLLVAERVVFGDELNAESFMSFNSAECLGLRGYESALEQLERYLELGLIIPA